MRNRWAVTGATGLLGNNLIRTLCARGAEVTVLARGEDRPELAGLPVRVVSGDLEDSALRTAFAEAEVVVHAAASVWIGMSGRADLERVNVEGTRAVCRAVPEGARLVHVSTVDALGLRTREHPADEECLPQPHEGGVPYVDTKRAADAVVRASGTDHVIVHPCLIVGPWDWRVNVGKMMLAVRSGQGRLAPPGGNNFVHVQDVVEGVIAAATAPSGRAWILGNENLSYREAWTMIAAITGGPAPVAELPRWVGAVASGMIGVPHRLGMREGDINAATARFGFVDHYFDSSRARRELGLPATSVATAFAEEWAWMKERGLA